MKKLISLFLVFSLLISGCSTVKQYASGGIDTAADSVGLGKASGVIKKAVIKEDKGWNDGAPYAGLDIVYRAGKSQDYLNALFNTLESYSGKDTEMSIFMLRTARVQGLVEWGTNIKITRGMFNMIYDESELACLIGHEIGHSVLGHSENRYKEANETAAFAGSVSGQILKDSKYGRPVQKQQSALIKTGWSRNQEKEADKYGAELAAKAGYDPYAFCDLFERLASRVDMDFIYRLKKIEGSHPALDDRAKSLRMYLQKKGYKEGEGKRNRQQYLDGMEQLHSIRTGEEGKDAKKIQKGIDEQGKKDLKRLDTIFKEVEGLKKANKPISMSRFLEIMDEISSICKKYGVTAEDIFGVNTDGGDSFMEESIVQDSPFWEMFRSIKDAVAGKVGNILNLLGHVAVGAIPVVGDVVDLYELFAGRDIFTGEKLSAAERALTALGLLISSGASWRNAAKGIEREASQMGLDGVKKSVDDAVFKIEKHSAKKTSGSAYDSAKAGNQYSKEYKNSLKQTTKELERGIKSHQKVVNEHADKIANPEKYVTDFYKRDKRYQDGLINRWKKDMERAEAYRDIKEGILIERGGVK